MKNKKLEMIKAFAELEGVELSMYSDEYYTPLLMKRTAKSNTFTKYNPLLPNALNCAARDKYMVEISYHTQFDCGPDGSGSYDIPYAVSSVGMYSANTPLNDISSEAICLTVIECILKSQGL